MFYNKLLTYACLSGLVAATAVSPPPAEPRDKMELEERQIVGGLQCVVAGVGVLVQNLLGDPQATAFCQSVLGLNTATIYRTIATTVLSTTTIYITTGTNVRVATLTTVPTTATVRADVEVTITTCVPSAPALPKRQAVAVSTPGALAGSSPSSISVVCGCLAPPTPSTTAIVTQTSVSVLQATVSVEGSATITSIVTPTLTVTITPTSTIQSCATAVPTVADTSCGNAGMQWAYYPDPRLDGLTDPSILRTATPAAAGAADPATAVGRWDDNCDYHPGLTAGFYDTVQPCVYFAFAFRGFVYAPAAGDYVFTLTAADDLVHVWVGDGGVVRDGYGVDSLSLSNRQGWPRTFTYRAAAAGAYIPLRVVLNQITGPWTQGLSIQAPDGSVLLGGGDVSQNIVQFGCGGSTFAWRPWGREVAP